MGFTTFWSLSQKIGHLRYEAVYRDFSETFGFLSGQIGAEIGTLRLLHVPHETAVAAAGTRRGSADQAPVLRGRPGHEPGARRSGAG